MLISMDFDHILPCFRESLEQRREDMKARWNELEARRRARIQYYHAKIHHERQQNSATNERLPPKSA